LAISMMTWDQPTLPKWCCLQCWKYCQLPHSSALPSHRPRTIILKINSGCS
jgi:hypothetical protein